MEPNTTPQSNTSQENNSLQSIPQEPLNQNPAQGVVENNSQPEIEAGVAQAEIDAQLKEVTPTQKPKMSSDPDLPRLRTFQEDVKNAVETNNVSTSKMFLAEQAKRDRIAAKQQKKIVKDSGPINIQDNILQPDATKLPSPVQEKPKKQFKANKRVLAFIISLTLFIAGGIGIYYNLEYLKPYFENARITTKTEPVHFIDSENKIFIDTEKLNKGEIVRDYQKIISENNTSEKEDVTEFVLTENTLFESEGETKNVTQRISASDLLSILDANPPENLVRSFEGSVLLGFYNSDKAEPFIILKSEDLNQTYAGMLAWEFRLGNDISEIFFQNIATAQNIIDAEYKIPEIEVSSSTATTTSELTEGEFATSTTATTSVAATEINPAVQIPKFNPNNFVDLIISNRDVRAVLNASNEIVFFYSLIDNENVVITTNKATFDKVLNKINNAKLIR